VANSLDRPPHPAGGVRPAPGNAAIDALLRRASPDERQHVIEAVRRHLGGDSGAVQRALQQIQQRFGGRLPPIDDNTLRQLQQQFGGNQPTDPAAAEAEIRRRFANDPAARQQAIDALRQRGASLPASR
jgi:hypothetical protein